MMSEELSHLIQFYKGIEWAQLLRNDLGSYHLKAIKENLDFIKKYFDHIINHDYFKNLPSVKQNILASPLQSFKNTVNTILQHQNTGKNQSVIDEVLQFKVGLFANLEGIHQSLTFMESLHGVTPDLNIKDYKKTASKDLKDLKEMLAKAKNITSQQQSQIIEEEVSQYGDFFKKESDKNTFWARVYLVSTTVLAIIFVGLAYWTFTIDPTITAQNIPELIIRGNLLNKVFIFSIMLLVLTLLKRQYLALRHQATLNIHRHNSFKSHKEVLSSIESTQNESDKEISNAILLELTKSMFSTQNTGFINEESSAKDAKIVEISRSLFGSTNRPE